MLNDVSQQDVEENLLGLSFDDPIILACECVGKALNLHGSHTEIDDI